MQRRRGRAPRARELPVFRLDSPADGEGRHRLVQPDSEGQLAAGGIGGHGRAEKQAAGVELPAERG